MTIIDKLAWIPIKQRKVLYVRSKGKELFFNAGGKRQGNETDQEALTREIQEELGVALKPDTIVYQNTFTAQAQGKPEGTLVEIKCYSAECVGNIMPMSEIEEIAWFTSADHNRTTITGKLILDWLHKQNLID